MPELLEESIAEVMEQPAQVADTAESPGSTIADETQAEHVIEAHESAAESIDKPEAPVLSDSVIENAMVDESVAVLEEPGDVLEEPAAVLDEPAAAVPEETGAMLDEPGAEHAAFECTSEAPVLTDEPTEIPVIEEAAAVLAEPIAEAADQCSDEAAAEAHTDAIEVTEIDDQAAPVDEAASLV